MLACACVAYPGQPSGGPFHFAFLSPVPRICEKLRYEIRQLISLSKWNGKFRSDRPTGRSGPPPEVVPNIPYVLFCEDTHTDLFKESDLFQRKSKGEHDRD